MTLHGSKLHPSNIDFEEAAEYTAWLAQAVGATVSGTGMGIDPEARSGLHYYISLEFGTTHARASYLVSKTHWMLSFDERAPFGVHGRAECVPIYMDGRTSYKVTVWLHRLRRESYKLS